ncbi:MAG: type IV secretion system DNA-binding domain-containing protein, partial [Oscillospiraceae bacterium]|nr:type IV secretion system DNA-binding domain-containing protein [Oscillospiraceae bacterium]
MIPDLPGRALIIGGVGGMVALLVLLGSPREARKTREGLQQAGLVNHAGEAPILLSRRPDKANPRLTVWEFGPLGIPLDRWNDQQAAIETALGILISKITWGKGRHSICVHAVPAEQDLPDFVAWDDSYLSPRNSELVLGVGLLGPVAVDISTVPHILLGGSTGSGKSVLLKTLLMQAIKKGADVYIADLKGGVDFPQVWHEKCTLVFEEEPLLEILENLVGELERRKRLLSLADCPNIDVYNKRCSQDLRRIIIACDEIAEVLDRSGRSKDQKLLIEKIESRLSTIARQGRAFGLHLILATQRPDANILPGQVKNNMDTRACGRADNVLSQIILDNTDAADVIPKDARGRFLLNDGTLFQTFWFDDNDF